MVGQASEYSPSPPVRIEDFGADKGGETNEDGYESCEDDLGLDVKDPSKVKNSVIDEL